MFAITCHASVSEWFVLVDMIKKCWNTYGVVVSSECEEAVKRQPMYCIVPMWFLWAQASFCNLCRGLGNCQGTSTFGTIEDRCIS